jgi:hypothetical protein
MSAESGALSRFCARRRGRQFFKGQPEELYEHLTRTKTLKCFTAAEGAAAYVDELPSAGFLNSL